MKMRAMRDDGDLAEALEEEPMTDGANIALFGATGAGKSTLINAIFGAAVADTGVGDPVTTSTEMFVNPLARWQFMTGLGWRSETGRPFEISDGGSFETGGATPAR